MPLSISLTLIFLAAAQLIELSMVPVTLAAPAKEVPMSQSSNTRSCHQEQVTELTGKPVIVSVPFPTQSAPERHVLLNIDGIKYNPSNVIPYEIYINLPPALPPNPGSPYYTGKLALYGYPQGSTFSLDITDVVNQLQKLKLITGDIVSVTFVPPADLASPYAPQLPGEISFRCVTITSSP